ncbi:MAG: EamA family transporter [Kiritimatiellae bacterium]|nr:EamA family transporter [Kiritimatiellia bacterium]
MWYLVIASLIWGLSFGLIKNLLAGLPPAWLGMVRMAVAAAVFLPFLRRVRFRSGLALFLIGMLQFGVMYLAYMRSFVYLKAHEVALYTVVTPLYVSALNDLWRRRFNGVNQLCALLAVAAAALILRGGLQRAPLVGFLLVQMSNLCFAAGQLAYREYLARWLGDKPADRTLFAWLYCGGFAGLAPFAFSECLRYDFTMTPLQIAVVLYLGAVASGAGFFLWNAGARRVSAGVLAVMNNMKIPAGVLVSLSLFGESVDALPLLAGIVLFSAALVPVCRGNLSQGQARRPGLRAKTGW